MSALGKIAARGMGITMLSQILRLGIQMGSVLILSRILSPREVGLVAMVTSVIWVADLIRDFGLSSGAIQAPTLSHAERSNLFWVNLALGTACAIVAAASAPLLAMLYKTPEVTAITLALAGMFVVSGATTQHRADLTRNMKFTALAAIDILSQFLAAAFAITAALLGASYWSVVIQQLVLIGVGFIGCVAVGRWVPAWYQRGVDTRKFFKFGGPILGTNLMGYALNNVDNIGIGAIWGAGPVGVYSRAYQLLIVPLGQIQAPLGTVVLPTLSKVQDDKASFDSYVRRLHLVGCYLFGTSLAVLGGLSWPIVAVLLGPQWAETAPIFAVLAAGGIFKALTMVSYQVYVAKGLTGKLFGLYLKTRPIMLAMILGGLPWGPIGVAFGHLVAAVWFWWYSMRAVSRIAGVDLGDARSESLRAVVLVSFPAAAVAWAVTWLLHTNDLLECILGALAAAAWIALTAVIPTIRRDLVTVLRTLRLAMPGGRG